MSKPDDIDQEAWDVAYRLHSFTEYDEVVARAGSVAELHAAVDHDVALFARAFMARDAAQRERDAALAFDHAENERALQHAAREARDRHDALVHMYCAQGLESLGFAIRSGAQP